MRARDEVSLWLDYSRRCNSDGLSGTEHSCHFYDPSFNLLVSSSRTCPWSCRTGMQPSVLLGQVPSCKSIDNTVKRFSVLLTPQSVVKWPTNIRIFGYSNELWNGRIFAHSNFLGTCIRPPFIRVHPVCREKGTPQWTPKFNDIKGCMTLRHSNWTICSTLNIKSQNEFPLFNSPHAAFPFSCMQRKGHPTVDPESD